MNAHSLKAMGLPERIVDPKAKTRMELLKILRSHSTVTDYIRENLASGEWEQVYKFDNGRMCKAYRAGRRKR